MNTTNLKLATIVLLTLILATLIPTAAQSARHDKMDARAARADVRRLMVIRRRCIKYKNWRKLDQTDRLIAKDKQFIAQDGR